MKEKYLPIGTLCTLKGKNKKTLIVGYFGIEYNGGNAIMYDYSGYDYPEGLLTNKLYSFNHKDIQNIDHLGYINEEYQKFNQILLNQNNNETKENLKTHNFFKNIKFDENGVVIFEELNEEFVNNYTQPITNIQQETKEEINFFTQQNSTPSTIVENADNSKNWSIFKNIKFDENGVIIEEETYTQEELQQLKEQQ